MEEPPLYRVDSQLQPAQHRIDGDHGINYSDHPRQLYPGKMYEGSEVIGGYSSNAGSKFGQPDMTGSIEKPPPMGNREDRMSVSRYYASAVNHQTIDGHQPSPQQQQQQQMPRNPTQIQLPNSQDNNNNMVYNMNGWYSNRFERYAINHQSFNLCNLQKCKLNSDDTIGFN